MLNIKSFTNYACISGEKNAVPILNGLKFYINNPSMERKYVQRLAVYHVFSI